MKLETNDKCIWNRNSMHMLIELLLRTYTIDFSEFIINNIAEEKNYFEILVTIILSQNTSDKNAIRALHNLKSILGSITPDKILGMDDQKLMEAIKVAGLGNRKTRTIKELALILSKDPGILENLKDFEVEKARKKLLELPGVGPKTADVFLLMVLRKPTFPIDTHINRVVRRLGIVSGRHSYEDIRAKILSLIGNDIEKLILLHLLLIVHGRKICRARNPRCDYCALSIICCKIF